MIENGWTIQRVSDGEIVFESTDPGAVRAEAVRLEVEAEAAGSANGPGIGGAYMIHGDPQALGVAQHLDRHTGEVLAGPDELPEPL
jgi:hypothetical protein